MDYTAAVTQADATLRCFAQHKACANMVGGYLVADKTLALYRFHLNQLSELCGAYEHAAQPESYYPLSRALVDLNDLVEKINADSPHISHAINLQLEIIDFMVANVADELNELDQSN